MFTMHTTDEIATKSCTDCEIRHIRIFLHINQQAQQTYFQLIIIQHTLLHKYTYTFLNLLLCIYITIFYIDILLLLYLIIYICICNILYIYLFYICVFTIEYVKIYEIKIETTRKLQILTILKNSQSTTFEVQIKPFSEGKKKPNSHEI